MAFKRLRAQHTFHKYFCIRERQIYSESDVILCFSRGSFEILHQRKIFTRFILITHLLNHHLELNRGNIPKNLQEKKPHWRRLIPSPFSFL